MLLKLPKDQKGIGGILIIAAVVFVIIAIAVMAYFLLNGGKQATDQQSSEQSQTESNTITDEQVPLKICETGDPEQCNDPVSNSDVDNIQNIEDEYP